MAKAAACSPAAASLRSYGRQLVKSPRWGNDLEDLVNSPLRVEGVSSLRGEEFYFDGNTDQINQLIATYAKTKAPLVHLTVSEDCVYSLSLQIQHQGNGGSVLTVYVQNAAVLAGLRIPRGVTVEAVSCAGDSLDPTGPVSGNILLSRIQELVARTARR